MQDNIINEIDNTPKTSSKLWRYTSNVLLTIAILSAITAGVAFAINAWWALPFAIFLNTNFAFPFTVIYLKFILSTTVTIAASTAIATAVLATIGGLFRRLKKVMFSNKDLQPEIPQETQEIEEVKQDILDLDLKPEINFGSEFELAPNSTSESKHNILFQLKPLPSKTPLKSLRSGGDSTSAPPTASATAMFPNMDATIQAAFETLGINIKSISSVNFTKLLRSTYLDGVKKLHPDKHLENKSAYKKKFIAWQDAYETIQKYLEEKSKAQDKATKIEKENILAIEPPSIPKTSIRKTLATTSKPKKSRELEEPEEIEELEKSGKRYPKEINPFVISSTLAPSPIATVGYNPLLEEPVESFDGTSTVLPEPKSKKTSYLFNRLQKTLGIKYAKSAYSPLELVPYYHREEDNYSLERFKTYEEAEEILESDDIFFSNGSTEYYPIPFNIGTQSLSTDPFYTYTTFMKPDLSHSKMDISSFLGAAFGFIAKNMRTNRYLPSLP